MNSFHVMLDSVAYAAKPTPCEVAAITRRLQRSGAVELDAASFCEAVQRGQTWVGGCYVPSAGGWGEFIGQQLFAIDVDNATQLLANGKAVRDADGHAVKRALRPGEAGFLDPVDALERCEQLGLAPLCLYFTKSARCPDWPRFRLVFDVGEPLDQDTAQAVVEQLLALFPQADPACKNSNRLFFGSNGELWDAWRVWG